MSMESLVAEAMRRLGPKASDGEPALATPMPGLVLLRHPRPTRLEATVYDPLFCLILQGAKEVTVGGAGVVLTPGRGLLVSHDLPVLSRVTDARPAVPYLALVLTLDVGLLRGLADAIGDAPPVGAGGPLLAHTPEPELLGTVARYLRLAEAPLEARVLGPDVRRELHFRLLTGPCGGMLRERLRRDSAASQIAHAIARIRRDFREPLAVPDLARVAGMSDSTFHRHFKAVTSTTPLQYQKALRLMEARRLLAFDGRDVAGVAYEVGYESPTQFSREYRRRFGASPRADRSAPTA